eukprot:1375714-Amphidinium_carterae.1
MVVLVVACFGWSVCAYLFLLGPVRIDADCKTFTQVEHCSTDASLVTSSSFSDKKRLGNERAPRIRNFHVIDYSAFVYTDEVAAARLRTWCYYKKPRLTVNAGLQAILSPPVELLKRSFMVLLRLKY